MLFRYLSDLYHAQVAKWRAPKAESRIDSAALPVTTEETRELAPVVPIPKTIEKSASTTLFQASKGNITVYPGDAIVNAANSALMPGGGVCGAIFNASDFDQLEEACIQLNGCPTGQAKVTPSFGMQAPWIVHAVGPVWEGGDKNEPELLAGAYRSSLEQAHLVGARSIAFPAISTGIYGYPLVEATAVAVATINAYTQEHPEHFDSIDVLCFDDKTLNCYLNAMAVKSQTLAGSINMTEPMSL